MNNINENDKVRGMDVTFKLQKWSGDFRDVLKGCLRCHHMGGCDSLFLPKE